MARADIPIHPHGPDWTSWENDGDFGIGSLTHRHPIDGVENGDEAHQHYINHSFNGPFQTVERFSFYGAWLDRTAIIDDSNPFTDRGEYQAWRVGHSYMELKPRYRFVGDNWNNNAIDVISSAFGLWSQIHAERSPVTGKDLTTGWGFQHVTGNEFEIRVHWTDLPDTSGGGSVPDPGRGTHNVVDINFDSSFDWTYDFDCANSQADKWHLMSVALHEIGHLAFLEHSPTRPTDLMQPVVGQPLLNVGDVSYRWCDYHEGAGEDDYFEGVVRNLENEGETQALLSDYDNPDAIKSMYSIPIPEPASLLLLTLGACLQVRRRAAR